MTLASGHYKNATVRLERLTRMPAMLWSTGVAPIFDTTWALVSYQTVNISGISLPDHYAHVGTAPLSAQEVCRLIARCYQPPSMYIVP